MNGGPKSHPACLSCGSFEEAGSIEYKRGKEGREIYGMVMCRGCLCNPDRINIKKIMENLRRNDFWEDEDIELIGKALELFKKGKMRRRQEPDGTTTYYRK
ncbi:MAG: hypothetical protein GF370_05035 [Candidatus Nealsonbacteria bacterium]|nr:hypothetical protein [Candidatus Nealsonbacteria bacterium]